MVKISEKRFYWIKLKTNFFSHDEIDFLMSQKDGANYVVLYQMLCLATVNNNGELSTKLGEMIVPYDVEKIVRDTKYFNRDTVVIALELFKKLSMIYEERESGLLKIANYEEMVGSESSSAKRVREWRQKKNEERALQCNIDVTLQSNHIETQEYRDKSIEIRDKSIEKDKEHIKRVSDKELQERFNVLWGLYPRKQGKQNAFNSYKKAVKNGVTDDQIERGIRDYLYYIEKTGIEPRYIKQGSTWFNQRCWNDDYTVSAKKEEKDVLTRMMEEEKENNKSSRLFDVFGFESSKQDDYIDVQYCEKE